MSFSIRQKSEKVLRDLEEQAPQLYDLVNEDLPLPDVYEGAGDIKLIVLGQDPTINNAGKLVSTTTVLRLDMPGPLRSYLVQVCRLLNLDLSQHVYATNYFKNFFTSPPVQLAKQVDFDLFEAFGKVWLPLLREELAQYPCVPVVTLGEPILQILARGKASRSVRYYWGYSPEWNDGITGSFSALEAADNPLERLIFPFPHITSVRTKKFYSDRLREYVRFMGRRTGLL